MRSRFKLTLAKKFEHPLVRLLVLDWRFSCLLLLVIFIVLAAVVLPFKIWKRTPDGFKPEIKISTLDVIQAHALARSARKAAQRQDFDGAQLAWAQAFANDPCNQEHAAGYIKALLQSKKRADIRQTLQIALWLQSLAPVPSSWHCLIAAADANEEWNVIVRTQQLLGPAQNPPDVQASILKALFRSGRIREAREFLNAPGKASPPGPISDLYSEAIDCILDPAAETARCAKLRARIQPGSHEIEPYEIYLVTCAEKGNLAEFQNTLNGLKQITDQTLTFDVIHVRLLLRAGRVREAREVAARFRAPQSGLEAFRIAEALVSAGNLEGATTFLAGYRSEFQDSGQYLVLYARLLVQQGKKKELAVFRKELHERTASPALELLMSGIDCFLEDSPSARNALHSHLERVGTEPFNTDLWFFAVESLLASGHPRTACQVLWRLEPHHLQDPGFYGKLFAMAEVSRDVELMRRAAERAYRLTPDNLEAGANYAAILLMCDEETDRALTLTDLYLKAHPNSPAAKINRAAALINSDQFGSADLILRGIDESKLSPAARNQLRFVQVKRAARIGDRNEVLRLTPLLEKSNLYSVQLGWLAKNGI